MKIKLKIEKEYDAKKLVCRVGARYCEDAEVNGVQDKDGKLMPFMTDIVNRRDGEFFEGNWRPSIDIETGTVIDWPKGAKAFVHYKACDDGEYILLDAEENEITRIDGYVPSIMCPADSGYGDYSIMHIDESGKIENWNTNLDDFIPDED